MAAPSGSGPRKGPPAIPALPSPAAAPVTLPVPIPTSVAAPFQDPVLVDLSKNPPQALYFDFDRTLNEPGANDINLPPSARVIKTFDRYLETGKPAALITGRSFDSNPEPSIPTSLWNDFISLIHAPNRANLFFSGRMGAELVQFDKTGKPEEILDSDWNPVEKQKIQKSLDFSLRELKLRDRAKVISMPGNYLIAAPDEQSARTLSLLLKGTLLDQGMTYPVTVRNRWIQLNRFDKGDGARLVLAAMKARGLDVSEAGIVYAADDFNLAAGKSPGADAAVALALPRSRMINVGKDRDSLPVNVRNVATQGVEGSLQVMDAILEGLGVAKPRPKTDRESVAFRRQIREPGVYLLERDAKSNDDSNGLKLTSSRKTQDMRDALASLTKDESLEALAGRTFYVTGVEMGYEEAAARRFQWLAEQAGIKQPQVRVLSVPAPWSKGRWKALRDRIAYFLPSRSRDYQAPIRDEIVSGAVTTLALEVPNAFYVVASFARPDAWLVLAGHTLNIGFHIIFQRSIGNWVLRANGLERFSKQLLLTLPFVLNYNVLSQFSAIRALQRSAGWTGVLERLPQNLAQFGTTQGLTLFIETFFYAWIVRSTFQGWATGQKSPEDSAAARAWVSILLFPWLWLNSIFMTQASTASTVLASAGPLQLTLGHVFIAAQIAVGSIFAFFPKLLDATLPWYKTFRAFLSRVADRFRAPKQG